MVQLSNVLMTLLAASASSALAKPKPIGQKIADATWPWEQACKKASGGAWCHTISGTASLTLRSGSAPCDQQDAADMMVDLAKSLHNNTDMIRLAQIFVQQPRNSRDRLQVPYCQKAPKNAELNGYFNCQFSGSDLTKFSGDQAGHLPLGVAAVVPAGSCPARNSSVPDGQQLNKLVSSPGKPASHKKSKVSRDVTNSPSNTTMDDCDPDNDGNPGHGALNNGTDPSSLGNTTALFSGLLSSNTTTPNASDPGSILRRVLISDLKDAKPNHIPFESHRVKSKLKHKHHKSKPKHKHHKHKHPKHKHHKSKPQHKHHKSKPEHVGSRPTHGMAKSGHWKVKPQAGQTKLQLAHTRPKPQHPESKP